MARKDYYYNKAKQEDYRSRSAYKLHQIDTQAAVITPGRGVVDLGAAPGGWLQVAVERGGEPVIGVDRQRIEPLEGVQTVRGDIFDDDTVDAVRALLDRDGTSTGHEGSAVGVVVSDMAPDMTGEYSVDHARSVHLAHRALEIARELVGTGGNFVVKVFDGRDLESFRDQVEGAFDSVRIVRPEASRDESSEVYVVAKGRLTAPVTRGDVLTVTIVDTGREGDGIAKVDGFTVFVPDSQPGETVEIEITDVKPRFGFAERVE